MGSKFGKNYPVLARSNEREKVLFVLAAGLAFCLLIVLVIVVKVKSTPGGEDQTASLASSDPMSDVSTVSLLAPERPVAAGTNLAEVNFKQVYWPRNQVPEGAVRDLSEVKNLYAKTDLSPGSPLQRSHLTSELDSSILKLTPGQRAVAIDIDASSAVEYHIRPGSRVDVILTHYVNRELTSQVIVQNARVLSLGGDVSEKDQSNTGGRRGRLSMQTATLDVATDDALKIQTAKRLGQLSLMMRSHGDMSPVLGEGISGQDINKELGKSSPKGSSICSKGRIRIAGKGEFLLDCDGSMTPVLDDYEP